MKWIYRLLDTLVLLSIVLYLLWGLGGYLDIEEKYTFNKLDIFSVFPSEYIRDYYHRNQILPPDSNSVHQLGTAYFMQHHGGETRQVIPAAGSSWEDIQQNSQNIFHKSNLGTIDSLYGLTNYKLMPKDTSIRIATKNSQGVIYAQDDKLYVSQSVIYAHKTHTFFCVNDFDWDNPQTQKRFMDFIAQNKIQCKNYKEYFKLLLFVYSGFEGNGTYCETMDDLANAIHTKLHTTLYDSLLRSPHLLPPSRYTHYALIKQQLSYYILCFDDRIPNHYETPIRIMRYELKLYNAKTLEIYYERVKKEAEYKYKIPAWKQMLISFNRNLTQWVKGKP